MEIRLGGKWSALNESSPGRIFISYRRQETAWPARQLYDVLVEHFGAAQVFKDVDHIDPGVDFPERISAAVQSSDVLLTLIGPDWLTMTDANGQPRLENPEDYVRLEIETALKRKIRVIPVLVDHARMPSADELPPSLAPLVRRNAVEINPLTFDTKRLITAVQKTLVASAELVDEPTSAQGPPAPQPQKEGADPGYDQGAYYKGAELICEVCGTSNPRAPTSAPTAVAISGGTVPAWPSQLSKH
jgi:TIR domain